MNDFVPQFIVNFLADLTLAVFLGVAAIAISSAAWRRDVYRFFDIRRPRTGAIAIRLSCMNVLANGCTGTDMFSEGFVGSAISELEYRYALRLAQSVHLKPIARVIRTLRDVPGSISDEPVVCEIRMSEQCEGNHPVDFTAESELMKRIETILRGGTFVLIGEPIYNVMTGYVLARSPSRFRFVGGRTVDEGKRRAISVENLYNEPGPGVRQEHERTRLPDGSNIEYAILERITGWNGATILICAGTSTSATIAALRELTHWRELTHRFDKGHRRRDGQSSAPAPRGNFGILYQVRTRNVEDVPEQVDVVERWQYPSPRSGPYK